MNKLDIKEIKKGAVRVFEKKQDMLDFVKKYAFDSLICFLNRGITEPLEPSTLPKRVVTN